jgi:hypothetical protein
MTAWLGVTGYTLKDTILNAIASISSNLQLSQRVAGHSSQRTTEIYTRLTAISDALQVTSHINIPGLDHKFGSLDESATITYLQSLKLTNIKYATFFEDWLERLMPRLYSAQYEKLFHQDAEVDFTFKI